MVRVLQIVDSMGTGGIQAFIMNVYRAIDRNQVQFDFLLQRRFNNDYEREIEELGGKIFVIPSRREGILKSRNALKRFFDENSEYRAVHMHISSLSYITPLRIAQNHGVPVRIVHSHSTRAPGNKLHVLFHRINQSVIGRVATDLYACSELAADWFYGKGTLYQRAVIVPNGIICTQYAYNPETREKYRNELCWNGKTVLGHVGRFGPPKNHSYLIDIFHEYSKVDGNAVLALVGDGNLREEAERKVQQLGLQDKVLFLGNRSDVPQLLQAMDLFLLPSLYEGFPVSLVEAQASGLSCLTSETVTHSSDLTGRVTFHPIDQPASEWVQPIIRALENNRNLEAIKAIREKGFDIAQIAQELQEKYVSAYR